MKLLKMMGQIFLILCWCMIITLGVILIQNRFFDGDRSNIQLRTKEEDKPRIVVSLDNIIEKYRDEIEVYIEDLSIETMDNSTLRVSFTLKEGADPSSQIPMLKKISSLIEPSLGKNISFKVRFSTINQSGLTISVNECKIDTFTIPDFLVDPLNQMLASSLDEWFQQHKEINIQDLYVVENQIILVGNLPEEVQKVWLED